jgi:hypothetical protein
VDLGEQGNLESAVLEERDLMEDLNLEDLEGQ